MGQKGSKVFVAEDCLRPHHAHKCSDVDLKKLRAFIKTGKLAPCFIPYEGDDWRSREVCRLFSPGSHAAFISFTALHFRSKDNFPIAKIFLS